jgi:hypothetical protein
VSKLRPRHLVLGLLLVAGVGVVSALLLGEEPGAGSGAGADLSADQRGEGAGSGGRAAPGDAAPRWLSPQDVDGIPELAGGSAGGAWDGTASGDQGGARHSDGRRTGEVVWRGAVVDTDGRAIGGAVAEDAQTGEELAAADAEGHFELRGALPSSGLLRVGAEGHSSRIVPAGRPRTDRVSLVLMAQRRLYGTVVGAEDQAPLRAAHVRAESASWMRELQTDELGRFEVQDAPESEEVHLFVTYPQRVSLGQSEHDGLWISLERGRAVTGRVVDPQGAGVQAAVVVVGATQLTAPQRATTESDGTFAIYGIRPDEEFFVLAFSRAYASPLVPEWSPPDTGEVAVSVVRRGTVEVQRGRGRDRAEISLRIVDCPPGITDRLAGGGLTFPVAPGTYQLERDRVPVGEVFEVGANEHVTRPWPGPDLDPVEPTPGDETAQDQPTDLTVFVLDEGGRPLPNADVVVSRVGLGQAVDLEGQSDERGRLYLERVPAGALTVVAFFPGRVQPRPLRVPDGARPNAVRVTLALPSVLRGRVVPPREAELLLSWAPASDSAEDPDAELVRRALSSEDGTFVLRDLPPGEFLLEVLAPDQLPQTLRLELPLSQDLIVTLEADPRAGEHTHEPFEDPDAVHDEHGH